jgi:aminopeptidase C
MSEQKQSRLEIDDLEEDAVSQMIQFLYTGQKIPDGQAEMVLKAADKYGIEPLKV